MNSRNWRTRFVIGLGLGAATSTLLVAAAVDAAPAGPTDYYVDPVAGKDTNSGLTSKRALKSLSALSSIQLGPGDRILLKGGSTPHVGVLTIESSEDGTAASPITVTNYGSNEPALLDPTQTGTCVRVAGDHVTVSNVVARGCGEYGFHLLGSHDVLSSVQATGNIAGVVLEGAFGTVADSTIVDNDLMAVDTPAVDKNGDGDTTDSDEEGNDDYGAHGVLIWGDDATVKRNRINGHLAHSYDYGADGSAVEVYNASRAVIRHNRAHGNIVFVEVGACTWDGCERADDTVVAYNRVTGSTNNTEYGAPQHFIGINAGATFGANRNTRVHHNTVYLTGSSSLGLACWGTCRSDSMNAHANVIRASWYLRYSGTAFPTDHNIFMGGHGVGEQPSWDPSVEPLRLGASDTFVSDPATVFRDIAIADYHLRAGSPGIDQVAPTAGYTYDLDGTAVPIGPLADLGAYEFGG